MRAHIFVTAVGIAIAGCATTSPIVPIGNGNYELAGSSATALASGASQKIRLLQLANQYCAGEGKQMQLVNADATNGRMGSAAWANGSVYAPGAGAAYNAQYIHPGRRANADIIFRCQ